MQSIGVKSDMSKITESARGKACTMQWPGYSHNFETVVHCHYPIAGMTSGKGYKSADAWGARLCYDCHRLVDGRDLTASERKIDTQMIRGMFAAAVLHTQAQLSKEGLLGDV